MFDFEDIWHAVYSILSSRLFHKKTWQDRISTVVLSGTKTSTISSLFVANFF